MAAIVSYGALAQGAFFWDQASFFAASASVLGFAASARARGEGNPLARGFIVLVFGLGASVVANGWTPEARPAVATLAAAVAAAAISRALIARDELPRFFDVLTTVAAGVSLIGLVAVAFHFYPWATQAQGIWRLSSTLTYVNAAASFLMLAAPAAIMVIRARPGAASHIGFSLILTGLAATLSRGAAVAAVIAMLTLLIGGGRRCFDGLLRPIIGGLVMTAGILPSITSFGGRPSIAIAGLVIGALISVPGHGTVRRSRIAGSVFAASVVLIPMLFVGQGTGRVIDARVALASEDRLRTWDAALDQALEQPIFGTGPGTFHLVERVGADVEQTRFAHNEYLQIFSETGAFGLVAVCGALVLFGIGVMRARPPVPGARARWALAVAPCTAFAVHGFFDFVWHLPFLVFLAFSWLGIAATGLPRKESFDETGFDEN